MPLMGKGNFAPEMYFVVKAFRLKLKLFSYHLSETRFATLQVQNNPAASGSYLRLVISWIQIVFCKKGQAESESKKALYGRVWILNPVDN